MIPRGALAGPGLAAALIASAPARGDEAATMFDHPDDSRFYVGGQANAILQGHPTFHADYSGPNSLPTREEAITSYVITLYLGATITKTTEIFFDGEMAAGGGIGQALGLAGVTNLDVVRNPALGADPYPARFFVRQIVPLTSRTVDADRGHLAMAKQVPEERLELRAGKFATNDVFDANAVGSDSHHQFMNWTVDQNGAYDFAADTRGYTYGVTAELDAPLVSLRAASLMMPAVANGIEFDLHLDKARADQVELELRPGLLAERAGAVRLLGYWNHADMGSYREAIDAYLAGRDRTPDVTLHRKPGRVKYGIGLGADQEVTKSLRLFLRAGWNEGAFESFAFTEVNDTAAVGADLRGHAWRRAGDKVGLALVTNGLSRDHRTYLALGGKGFLLGDGALDYARETLGELYYDAHVWRGISAAFDYQLVVDPGYNAARGPVNVFALRVHLEI